MSCPSIRTVARKGNIGGASFHIESGTTSVSQKLIVHEHVVSNTPTIENFGSAAVNISLDVYTTGSGWLFARDAILAACQTGGPVSLVNPFYPAIALVQVKSASASNNKDDLGRCSIKIECVQTHPFFGGGFGFGMAPHFASALSIAVSAAISLSLRSMSGAINTTISETSYAATQAAWEAGMIAIDEARMLSVVDSGIAPYLKHSLSDLYLNAVNISLARNMTRGESLIDKIETYVDYVRYGISYTDILAKMPRDFNRDQIRVLTGADSVVAASSNEYEVSKFIRHMTGLLAGEAAAKKTYDTRREALEALNTYNIWYQNELEGINTFTDSDVHGVFEDARVATVTMFQANVTETIPVRDIKLPSIRTAMSVAMELYGDPDRAIEVWKGSGSPHPGFIGPNLTVKAA